MQTIPALEAKNHFGQLIEAAQRQPVTVTKQGRPAIVVMSTHDFESYQKQAGDKLLDVMSRMQFQAKESTNIPEKVYNLIASLVPLGSIHSIVPLVCL